VAAGIQGFELKVGVDFFAGLNGGKQAMVALPFELAAIEIDAVFGVDPVAVLLDQPIRPLRRQ
jgi:hypothetical protein